MKMRLERETAIQTVNQPTDILGVFMVIMLIAVQLWIRIVTFNIWFVQQLLSSVCIHETFAALFFFHPHLLLQHSTT